MRFPFLIPQYCYVVVKLCLRVLLLNWHCFYVVGKLCLCFPFLIPHYFYVVLIFNVNYFLRFWDSPKNSQKIISAFPQVFLNKLCFFKKLLKDCSCFCLKYSKNYSKTARTVPCFCGPVTLQQREFQP